MNKLRWLAAVMAVCSVAMIFLFSADDGDASGRKSRWVIERIAPLVHPDFADWPEARRESLIGQWQYPVRKAGHMAEFALLGVSLGLFARSGGRWRAWLLALLACVLIAAADEVHQIFLSGRGPSPADVGFDALGAAIGVWVASWRRRRR